MKNQIKHLKGLEIIISKSKSNLGLKELSYGPLILFWDNRDYEIVYTKRGKELKLNLGEARNKCDLALKRLVDARFTSEYIFIPFMYIERIKKASAITLL